MVRLCVGEKENAGTFQGSGVVSAARQLPLLHRRDHYSAAAATTGRQRRARSTPLVIGNRQLHDERPGRGISMRYCRGRSLIRRVAIAEVPRVIDNLRAGVAE